MQLFVILITLLHKYSFRGKTPFREYALPLKRERWHAKRAGEGATCPGDFTAFRMTYNIVVDGITNILDDFIDLDFTHFIVKQTRESMIISGILD